MGIKQYALLTVLDRYNTAASLWRKRHNPSNICVVNIASCFGWSTDPTYAYISDVVSTDPTYAYISDVVSTDPTYAYISDVVSTVTESPCTFCVSRSIKDAVDEFNDAILWMLDGTDLTPEEKQQLIHDSSHLDTSMVVLDETSEVQVALHDAIDTNQDMSIISSKIGKLASKKDVGSLFTTGRKQLCVDETESFQNERLALLQEAFESTSPLPMEAIRVCLSTV